MTVKQLIGHLQDCDPNAEVMVEGKAWRGKAGQSDLISGGHWPVLFVRLGTFPDTRGPFDDRPTNHVTIVGTDAWGLNVPNEGKHEHPTE